MNRQEKKKENKTSPGPSQNIAKISKLTRYRNILFLSLAAASTKSYIISRTLCATRNRISDVLSATLCIVDDGIRISHRRTSIRSPLILPVPFHSIDSFFTSHVPNRSGKAIFAELVAYKVVDIILELVDLADPGDFGFIQRIYICES